MKFRDMFEADKLEALLNTMKNEINVLSEGIDYLKKLKIAIQEFAEIENFSINKGLSKKDDNITISGEFKGGEKGSKHLNLGVDNKRRDKILSWLSSNLKKINKVL